MEKDQRRSKQRKIKLEIPKGLSLYPYQRKDARFFLRSLRRNGGAFNMSEMGTGKSVVTTVAVNTLACRKEITNVLVVCPAIMRDTWAEEFERWSTRPWNVQVIDKDSPRDKWNRQLPLPGTNVLIVSYRYLTEKKRRILKPLVKQFSPTIVICDEWHYAKNLKALRTKSALLLMSIARYKIALTGTPYTTNVTDLYAQLWPFAALEDIGENVWQFGHKFSNLVDNDFGKSFEGVRNEKELQEICAPFSRRRKLKEVVAELPDIAYRSIYVDIPKSLAKKSLKFVDIAVAKVTGENKYVDPELADHVSTMRKQLGLAKCRGIVEYTLLVLESVEQVVLFAYHSDVIEVLRQSLKKKGVTCRTLYGKTPNKKKQIRLKNFRRGKFRVLILQIRSAIGITLTNTHYGIVAELDWSHHTMDQAYKRLHRITQKNCVQIDLVIAKNSLDGPIREAIAKKRKEAALALGD